MQRFLEYLDKLGRDVRQRSQAKCPLDIRRQRYRARYAYSQENIDQQLEKRNEGGLRKEFLRSLRGCRW